VIFSVFLLLNLLSDTVDVITTTAADMDVD